MLDIGFHHNTWPEQILQKKARKLKGQRGQWFHNVCHAEKRTKHSSVLLLRLVRFSAWQTLLEKLLKSSVLKRKKDSGLNEKYGPAGLDVLFSRQILKGSQDLFSL